MSNNDSASYELRYNLVSQSFEYSTSLNWISLDLLNFSGAIVQDTTFSGADSFQGIAGDTTLTSGAGSTLAQGGSFEAAIMGNIHGLNLSVNGNYVAGVIGAYDIQGTNASLLPKAGVLGIIFDGSTTADGIVVGEIDGSDPSAVTRAGAVFKGRQLNTNAGSGVDYGLDLFDTAVSGYFSSPTLPLAIANADVRMTFEVCLLNGAGVPTDGVTGATFAQIGSLYIDRTNGKLYINSGAGTKASPVWKIVTSA